MLGNLCTKYMPWLVASVHTFALSVRVQNIARDACFGLSRLRLRLSLWRNCGKHIGRGRVKHSCVDACTRVALRVYALRMSAPVPIGIRSLCIVIVRCRCVCVRLHLRLLRMCLCMRSLVS